MAVQFNAKLKEDMARTNSDDIATPRNPFDLAPLLVNGDNNFAPMDFVSVELARMLDPGASTVEQEAKNKEKKDEIADRGYAAIRFLRDLQEQRLEDDTPAYQLNRRPQKDTSNKPHADNDDADIVVTAKRPSEQKAIKTNVQLKNSFTSSAIDNAYKATAQAVEDNLGKDAKEMGGSAIRAVTNTLSGDTAKAEKEAARAMNRAGNIVEDWTDRDTRKTLGSAVRGTFNAVAHPVDTGVAVAKTVGNAAYDTAASAVSAIKKIDLNPFS